MTSQETTKGSTTMKKQLTTMQRALLVLTIPPILAVGVAGGVGTYNNLSRVYGDGTALGALAAGEGATAVMALVLLITTTLGQSSPLAVRAGLWALPLLAATMGATAADTAGQTIVYALTPMAITASAEGLAFLVRRVVVHQEGRDVEAEARAAAIIRDLAYHQARAAAHPSEKVRKASVRKSWRLARKVGTGDLSLGVDLLDVQRTRLTQGADIALERMFAPGLAVAAPALLAVSADTVPALPAVSTGEPVSSRAHESTIQPDTSGYPDDITPEQAEETESVRPDLKVVRTEKPKRLSIAADVRQMVADGVQDVRHVVDAIATRHGREADDPRLQSTVGKYFRQAKADADTGPDADVRSGQYL
jgi:hypothetical protein